MVLIAVPPEKTFAMPPDVTEMSREVPPKNTSIPSPLPIEMPLLVTPEVTLVVVMVSAHSRV